VYFGLLGPLRVDAGRPIRIPAARQRVLLGALLLRCGAIVPADELAELVWDGKPPPGARTTLPSYVLRLRRVLGPAGERIRYRSPGYLIELQPDELDLSVFTAAHRAGRAAAEAGDWARASRQLREALALWRGEPLVDIPCEALSRDYAGPLADQRLQAEELRIEAELRLGRHQGVTADAERLAGAHPWRERLVGQLMLALYQDGRQADALAAYQRLRDGLVRELGVDPGAELQHLHRRILAADPELTPAARPSRLAVPRPAQLPADIPDFTGRQQQLDRLNPGVAGPRIWVITGTGGVGKTALAVHAAHRLAGQFPDGQLYLNLSGASTPLAPAEALARFLRDLGVDAAAVPADLDERAARYRSLVAERRLLIVLDDAADTAQVGPLLPGGVGCGVLVTSRARLADLAGAGHVDLEVLPAPTALALLREIVGADRITAEPEAATEILAACGGLPLAVRIAGVRLVSRPQWRLRDMASRLTVSCRRLDELTYGDLGVRATFQVSYAALAAEGLASPARTFRMLGLCTGQDIGLPAASALLGAPEPAVERALEVLVDAHLLESPAPNRYRFHDLVRAYAAERAVPRAERRTAITRLVTWYAQAASAADAVLMPSRRRVVPDRLPGLPRLPVFGSMAEAADWCEAEHANLVAAALLAADAGLSRLGWQLPTALWSYFHLRGRMDDWLRTHRSALASAQSAGDRAAEAIVRNNLAIGLIRVQRLAEAAEQLEAALEIRQAAGDRTGSAATLSNLACLTMDDGRPEEALDYLYRSLAINRDLGDRPAQAYTLANLGEIFFQLSRIPEAIAHYEDALARYEEQPAVSVGMAQVAGNLAKAHAAAGDVPRAVAFGRRTAAVQRELADRRGEGETLSWLGKVMLDSGDGSGAAGFLRQAAIIFRDLDDDRAAAVEAALRRLGGQP
jgi:DNA-binding SARP family transcriptional activator/tetratricopeptide (TPR) repeat protein